jgi:hypothetical protein
MRQMFTQDIYASEVNTINYLLSPYIYFIYIYIYFLFYRVLNQFLRYIHATLRYRNTLNFIFKKLSVYTQRACNLLSRIYI